MLEELLMRMSDTQSYLLERHNAEKNARKEQNAEKDRIDNDLMNLAMHSSANKKNTQDEESIPLRPSNKCNTCHTGIAMGKIAQFGAYLRGVDLACVDKDQICLV